MSPRQNRWPVGAAAVATTLALVAAGCGSSDSHATTAQSSAAARYNHELAASGRLRPPATAEKPVPASAFRAPTAAYRTYAAHDLDAMQAQVGQLRDALDAGDRAAAQAAWRRAFDRYLRLGAVYGEFGPLDTAIDGLPGGLPGGASDPHFTGLHRLERGLWGGQPLPSLVPEADRLATDVAKLGRVVPTVAMPPLDYATRAHEILEDAQRDFLSGADVRWSGEGVLATQAALAATDEVIDTLTPILDGDIATEVRTGLVRLGQALNAVRREHGGQLPTVAALSLHDRERLAGGIGGALESLQDVPGALETAVPPAVPTLPSR